MRPGAEFDVAVAEAAEAGVVEAATVLEDMTGLPDEVLVTTAAGIVEDDADVPVAAGVEAGELTPLMLRDTPTLPHNCCANCTVAWNSAASHSCITTGRRSLIQDLSSQKHV